MGVALMVKDQTYAELNERIKTLEKELQQRVQTETDLLEQEQKYRLIFEKARDAIFIIQNDVIRFANRRARTVLGYTDEELSTTAIAKLIHPKDRDLVAARHLKRLKGDKVPGTHSFRVISKTGKEIWVEHTAVRVSWEGQPGTLNFVRNITQKKKLDAQLQFAARLEAIGTLAGGIAHSFNNLLMGIQGHTSLLLLDIDSQGGAELTSQLIGYARKGRYRSKSIAINEIIENTSQTFQKMKREITIHLELTQRPHAIEADQGQMEQMLLNLYINAADAMPDGGEIYLKTKNVTHRDIKSKLYEARPGKYVRLTVSDRGVGIDKKIQHRIFDPFFTTKTIGKGTGLGLASVYGIVKRGRGTTFFIYLLAADKRKKRNKNQIPGGWKNA
jgi:PAS domain S-box-containing protein